MFIGLIIAAAVALLVLFFIVTYKVVDPNEAHVVVLMGRGRKVYSSSEGKKSAYFFIPLLMKRFVLPLTNQKMEIADIHLNDTLVAPFICDVVSWLRIADPIQAAERLNLADPFGTLEQDLIPIVQAVARTGAMKQEILDIMRDRETFARAVSEEVREVLKKWGVQLVNLDINDIRDDESKGSHVVSDYENQRKAQVNAESRKEIANQIMCCLSLSRGCYRRGRGNLPNTTNPQG